MTKKTSTKKQKDNDAKEFEVEVWEEPVRLETDTKALEAVSQCEDVQFMTGLNAAIGDHPVAVLASDLGIWAEAAVAAECLMSLEAALGAELKGDATSQHCRQLRINPSDASTAATSTDVLPASVVASDVESDPSAAAEEAIINHGERLRVQG